MMNIYLEKPNLKELNKQGFQIVDLHFHTTYSDGLTPLHRLIKRAKKLNIGVSITDHNEIKGSLKINNRIFNIPGIELTSSEGAHLILYFYSKNELKEFYNKKIKNKKTNNPYSFLKISTKEIIESSRYYNCLVCAAHPYGILWTGICKHIPKRLNKNILKNLDIIEAITSYNIKKHNLKAIELLKEINKPYSGGSDGHFSYDLGKTVTYSESHDIDSFLNSILKKKNFVIGKEVNLLRKAAINSSKIRKNHKTNFLKKGKEYIKNSSILLRRRVV